MVIENIWLVMSAFLTGIIFLLLYHANNGSDVVVTLIGGAVLWISMLRLTGEHWSFSPINLLLQLSVWVLAGLALWFIMPSSDAEQGLLAIGAFAASWAVGYLTIFAPGGLGVREVVLVVLLGAALPTNQGLVYSTMHRFLWIITEVILGLSAMRFDVKRGLKDE
jgi:uncharacterized membrane protein YbhN (UPF0104 family)